METCPLAGSMPLASDETEAQTPGDWLIETASDLLGELGITAEETSVLLDTNILSLDLLHSGQAFYLESDCSGRCSSAPQGFVLCRNDYSAEALQQAVDVAQSPIELSVHHAEDIEDSTALPSGQHRKWDRLKRLWQLAAVWSAVCLSASKLCVHSQRLVHQQGAKGLLLLE